MINKHENIGCDIKVHFKIKYSDQLRSGGLYGLYVRELRARNRENKIQFY